MPLHVHCKAAYAARIRSRAASGATCRGTNSSSSSHGNAPPPPTVPQHQWQQQNTVTAGFEVRDRVCALRVLHALLPLCAAQVPAG
jgi:hypothetical protein